MKIQRLILPSVAAVSALFGNSGCLEPEQQKLPNILWITTEDNSPFLGCYGDSFATSPNLDRLASEGFRYTHAYANAPVCAPTRNTILTGIYATSGGHQHMRSEYNKSDLLNATLFSLGKPDTIVRTTRKLTIILILHKPKEYGMNPVIKHITEIANRDSLFLQFLILRFLTKAVFTNQYPRIH